MDIRIASYRPNAFTGVTMTASQGAPLGNATVQNAASSSPVNPVTATASVQGQNASRQIANGGGYTDAIRGSLVNILA